MINFKNKKILVTGATGGIGRDIVRTYIGWLLSKGFRRSSVARKLSVIRGYFLYAVSKGLIDGNPVPAKNFLVNEKGIPHVLNNLEINRLIDATDTSNVDNRISVRDKAILETLYSAGLRVSELVMIDVADLNFDDKEEEDILVAFDKAKGFLRKKFGKQMKIRHVPELIFKRDSGPNRSIRISKLIDDAINRK